ncbi:MAG: DUF58 domain-containing protein [Mycobacterium leprae]
MRLSMRDWRLPALVLVSYIFARMSEGRLPYFSFYLTTILLILTYLWIRHALRRTDCLIYVESDRSEVGKSLGVRVRIDNESVLPLSWVEVDDATGRQLVSVDLPHQATSVPMWGSRMINYKLTARRRGHYVVGPIRLTLGDPFGVFVGQKDCHSKSTITVYPRVHAIEGLTVPLSQPFGPVRTRERAFEDPSNQAELRKYRPGDNPRHIHWKSTARMGDLMLREYELNATTQMMLFPDLCESAQTGAAQSDVSTEETTVEIAASLANLGVRHRVEVGLVCHAQERFAVMAGQGQRAFREILEVLARVQAHGHLPIEQVLEREAAHLSGKSTMVVITPRLTARLADTLIRYRANHQVMLVLLRRESFQPPQELPIDDPSAGEAAASLEAPAGLLSLLLLRHVSVYLVGAGDDLRRLGDLRLTTGSEGVKLWQAAAQLSGTR